MLIRIVNFLINYIIIVDIDDDITNGDIINNYTINDDIINNVTSSIIIPLMMTSSVM